MYQTQLLVTPGVMSDILLRSVNWLQSTHACMVCLSGQLLASSAISSTSMQYADTPVHHPCRIHDRMYAAFEGLGVGAAKGAYLVALS